MTRDEIYHRLDTARVATFASIGADGRSHLVPIVFVHTGDTLVTAVDHKPKRTPALRRLENISRDDRVTVLVHHYAEDWNDLWWIRIDGTAEIIPAGNARHHPVVQPLIRKYGQYQGIDLGDAIVVTMNKVLGWAASA